ncbi:hypothetical protein V5F53_11025 [Xanthobacter sp. V4C-4]|uniref:hypothetical protein n=1 Tax=Xanthobacter cornucopiae TaxID=3119924 RepID=UPI003728C64C
MQRFEQLPTTVSATSAAARISMSALDTAIARIPGLVHDMDVSRLADAASAGRCRGSGAKVAKVGAGVSRVASSYLNGKAAWRMATEGGSKVRIASAWPGADADFTLVFAGTLGAGTSGSTPTRNIVTIGSGTGAFAVLWQVTGGAMRFRLGTSGGLNTTSMPVANTPCIMAVQRKGAVLSLDINGIIVATATDTDILPDLAVQPIHLGSSMPVTTDPTFDGDCARFLAYSAAILTDTPAAWAELVAEARDEFGIA